MCSPEILASDWKGAMILPCPVAVSLLHKKSVCIGAAGMGGKESPLNLEQEYLNACLLPTSPAFGTDNTARRTHFLHLFLF